MTNERDQREEVLSTLMSKPSRVSDNTAQELIFVTRDRVELALHRNLPRYVPSGKILSSAGLFVALLVAVTTASFQEAFGVSGATWRGAFLLGTAASAVLLIIDFVKWVKRPSITDLVNEIDAEVESAKRK